MLFGKKNDPVAAFDRACKELGGNSFILERLDYLQEVQEKAGNLAIASNSIEMTFRKNLSDTRRLGLKLSGITSLKMRGLHELARPPVVLTLLAESVKEYHIEEAAYRIADPDDDLAIFCKDFTVQIIETKPAQNPPAGDSKERKKSSKKS